MSLGPNDIMAAAQEIYALKPPTNLDLNSESLCIGFAWKVMVNVVVELVGMEITAEAAVSSHDGNHVRGFKASVPYVVGFQAACAHLAMRKVADKMAESAGG